MDSLTSRRRLLPILALAASVVSGWTSALAGSPIPAPALSLDQAIQRALANQAQIREAEHIVAQRTALQRAASADLLPALSLAGGGIWAQTDSGQPLWASANGARELIGQLQLSVPLYAPQARALEALARDQATVAQYQARQTRLLVAAQVTAAYYRLALSDNELDVWRRALSAAQDILTATQKSYRAGTRSQLDLTQARLTVSKAQAGLDQTQPLEAAARGVLALQTAYASAAALPPLAASTAPRRELPLETALVDQAARAQPLLQVAEGQIQAAHALLRYHRAARLPVVKANLGYGWDTVASPQARNLGWGASVTLQMPLFGFGRNRDRIDAAHEHLEAMEAGKVALLLQIRSRMAADYGAAQAADNALRNDQILAREARAVYDMTRKGYLAGALSGLALQQAENNWVQARLKLAGAAIRARLARAQLALDSGILPAAEPNTEEMP